MESIGERESQREGFLSLYSVGNACMQILPSAESLFLSHWASIHPPTHPPTHPLSLLYVVLYRSIL